MKPHADREFRKVSWKSLGELILGRPGKRPFA